MNKLTYFDGMKSIELTQYPDEAWEWLTGKPDNAERGLEDFFKAIPWLFRGVNLRADAVANMPFSVYRGETEIDMSQEYRNAVRFMPNPSRLFKLIEMSISLMGSAYLFNVRNNTVSLDLKYLNPTTIRPVLDESEGLVGFDRTLTSTTRYDVDDIIYFWLEDPYVEIGEPNTSPGKAALMAAGVLANVDEFVAAFFGRGAIKATILGVPMGTPEPAREELKSWWDKVVSGIGNAFTAKVIASDAVEATTIGEGLEGLQNTSLTKEKREDISVALGIPMTKLWSTEAGGLGGGGVVEQDDKDFYNQTIIPECQFIQNVLNTQVFEPAGYSLRFNTDTLDMFQEDEAERSTSLNNLVNAGMPLDVGLQVLGFELTDEQWARLEAEQQAKEERAEQFAEQIQQRPARDDEDEEDNKVMHLDKWRRKAAKRLKSGKTAAVDFESEYISPTLNAAIMGALEGVETMDDLDSVFDSAWTGYP